jgi:predicted dehydrogenase
MSEVEPTRLAVIGAGGIAGAYVDIVAGSDELEAVAVADVRLPAASALAERMGCAAVETAEEVIAFEPDAVVLCTPPVTHPDLAQLFFAHGVAVLSEKPLAVDRHAAAAMTAAAAEAGVLLGMATKFRYCADVVAARELLVDGALGRLRLVENAFTSRVDMSARWNSDPAVSGGGVIIDNGTHSVDLVRYVAGPVAEVFAVEAARPDGFVVEDTVTLHLHTEDDVDATVDLSWSIDKSLSDFLRLYGTEGEVRVGWRESAWRRYGQDWQVIGPGYAKVHSMSGAVVQFARALRGEEELAVTPADGIASAQVVDACYESLRVGTWVKITDLQP